LNTNDTPKPMPWNDPNNLPSGDNPEAAKHISESTVAKLTVTLHEIVAMVETFDDMAPRSATRIWELLSIISGDILAWIRRWEG
uniref:hypothetical protein n=1 Tax=Nocardia sp. CC201C TaxID=3044575 RepID=UPI0024A9D6FB